MIVVRSEYKQAYEPIEPVEVAVVVELKSVAGMTRLTS